MTKVGEGKEEKEEGGKEWGGKRGTRKRVGGGRGREVD